MSRTRRKPDADAMSESVLTETDEDSSVLPSRDDSDIENAIQALGKGAECKIYRRTPTGRQYLGRPPAAGISEESVRSDYGGGKFEIRFFDSMGKYRRQVTIDIEGSPKIVGQRESSAVVAAPPSPDPSVTAEIRLLKAEISMQKASHEADRKLLLEMLGKLLPGPAPRVPQPVPALPVADLPGLLQMFRDFLPSREPKPSANLDEVMKIFQLGLQQAEAGGGGDGGQDWPSLVTKYAPQVLAFLSKMSAPPPVSAVPPSAPAISPTPSPPVMEPATPAAVESEVVNTSPTGESPATVSSGAFQGQLTPEHERFLRQAAIPYLKQKARANADPVDVAGWALDNLDEEMFLFLRQLVAAPVEEFTSFDAELGTPAYADWFTRFYQALRAGPVDPDTVEPEVSEVEGVEAGADPAVPGPDPADLGQ